MPLQYNSVRGYVSAVMDLFNEQMTSPSPRGIGVKAQLAALRAQRWERTRALHEGRAVGTILNNFTPAELTDFASCWEKHNSHYHSSEQYLRTLTNFLIGHYFLSQEELRLKADFAILSYSENAAVPHGLFHSVPCNNILPLPLYTKSQTKSAYTWKSTTLKAMSTLGGTVTRRK